MADDIFSTQGFCSECGSTIMSVTLQQRMAPFKWQWTSKQRRWHACGFIHLGNILSNSNENNEAESLREGTSYLRQGIFGKFGLYEWVPLVGHIIGGPSWCGNLQHVKYNSFSILHPTFLYINQMFDFYFRNQTSVRIKVSSLTSSTTLYHISSSQ